MVDVEAISLKDMADVLQRELGLLLKSQLWTLAHAEAHVLFPGSDHVETLAVFDRAPAPKRR